jgi:S-adenosylmethionine:tRNA ribosyltransferase-isomerase
MGGMRISDFDYELPENKIAQHPPKVRGQSRLLVLEKSTGKTQDKGYQDLVEYINPGDVVILNNTKVIPARLQATAIDGKRHELLLLELHGGTYGKEANCLYRGKLRAGDKLTIGATPVSVEAVLEGGIVHVSSSKNLLTLAEEAGSVPLPPYMKRSATQEDTERYQTIFAQHKGSVAAPTASLNFTEQLKETLESKGIRIVYLTLHVGIGTFLPIRTDEIEQHTMHSEYFEIPLETSNAIQDAKAAGQKITAVGTTVARTLEHAHKEILSAKDTVTGEADIFIYPGYEFKLVDQLLTNFHAPRSTVLMLTAAFASWGNLKSAYEHALENDYRFLSYGDSMLII